MKTAFWTNLFPSLHFLTNIFEKEFSRKMFNEFISSLFLPLVSQTRKLWGSHKVTFSDEKIVVATAPPYTLSPSFRFLFTR